MNVAEASAARSTNKHILSCARWRFDKFLQTLFDPEALNLGMFPLLLTALNGDCNGGRGGAPLGLLRTASAFQPKPLCTVGPKALPTAPQTLNPKPYKPFEVQETLCERQNTPTPFVNPTSTLYQPYINPTSTLHQPYINRILTLHKRENPEPQAPTRSVLCSGFQTPHLQCRTDPCTLQIGRLPFVLFLIGLTASGAFGVFFGGDTGGGGGCRGGGAEVRRGGAEGRCGGGVRRGGAEGGGGWLGFWVCFGMPRP